MTAVWISVLIALLAFLVILFLLVRIPPRDGTLNEKQLEGVPPFQQSYDNLPEPYAFAARDGAELTCRHYASASKAIVILLHGASMDGQYLHSLASGIARGGFAQVLVPDLRGYGPDPVRRGDCDYIGQIEDDLTDLLSAIRHDQPHATIVLGGHSMGGGTVLRYACNPNSVMADAYLLLAPAVAPGAPIQYPADRSTGVISVSIPRIIGLTILNAVGINRFNHLPVLMKNKPAHDGDGFETRSLSYRLLMSRMPGFRYQKALVALNKPTLLLVGENDEEFRAVAYGALFRKYNDAHIRLLPGMSHDSLVLGDRTVRETGTWLNRLTGSPVKSAAAK